jgi:hypothetical protein
MVSLTVPLLHACPFDHYVCYVPNSGCRFCSDCMEKDRSRTVTFRTPGRIRHPDGRAFPNAIFPRVAVANIDSVSDNVRYFTDLDNKEECV